MAIKTVTAIINGNEATLTLNSAQENMKQRLLLRQNPVIRYQDIIIL